MGNSLPLAAAYCVVCTCDGEWSADLRRRLLYHGYIQHREIREDLMFRDIPDHADQNVCERPGGSALLNRVRNGRDIRDVFIFAEQNISKDFDVLSRFKTELSEAGCRLYVIATKPESSRV